MFVQPEFLPAALEAHQGDCELRYFKEKEQKSLIGEVMAFHTQTYTHPSFNTPQHGNLLSCISLWSRFANGKLELKYFRIGKDQFKTLKS